MPLFALSNIKLRFFDSVTGCSETRGDDARAQENVSNAGLYKLFIFTNGLLLYAVFGGWLFSMLEIDHESERRRHRHSELNRSRYEFGQRVLSALISASDNGTFSGTGKSVGEIVAELEAYERRWGFVSAADEPLMWDFWGALFYAGTVFTTIGYGHYAPATDGGRAATIVYALFGIPLALAVLSHCSLLVRQAVFLAWNNVKKRCTLKAADRKHRLALAAADIVTPIALNESATSMMDFKFPLSLALAVIVAYMFMCAALFRLWEKDWSYFEAFYFFFISLSTIGFGDIVPDHPNYMILGFPLIFLGLALVSLIISLIQGEITSIHEKTEEWVECYFRIDNRKKSIIVERLRRGSFREPESLIRLDEARKTAPSRQPRRSVTLGLLQIPVGQTTHSSFGSRRVSFQTEKSLMDNHRASQDCCCTCADGSLKETVL